MHDIRSDMPGASVPWLKIAASDTDVFDAWFADDICEDGHLHRLGQPAEVSVWFPSSVSCRCRPFLWTRVAPSAK